MKSALNDISEELDVLIVWSKDSTVKNNSSDHVICFLNVFTSVPVVFAPQVSQKCIHLCNEVFMHCNPAIKSLRVIVNKLFLLTQSDLVLHWHSQSPGEKLLVSSSLYSRLMHGHFDHRMCAVNYSLKPCLLVSLIRFHNLSVMKSQRILALWRSHFWWSVPLEFENPAPTWYRYPYTLFHSFSHDSEWTLFFFCFYVLNCLSIVSTFVCQRHLFLFIFWNISFAALVTNS